MDNQRLWQHRSKEEDKEAILSLNLLERANVPKEKTLKCIYAVSNHIEEHYREVLFRKRKVAGANCLFRIIFCIRCRKIFCE